MKSDQSQNIEKFEELSIIIPVYNRENQVRGMLQTLSGQSVCPGEVILVDNNSTDDTLDVLKKWEDSMQKAGWRIKIIQESRPGAAAARQAGLDIAATEYVTFFDSDDKMYPDYVEKMRKDLSTGKFDMIVWGLRYIDQTGRVLKNRRILPHHPVENHMVQGLLSTPSYVVRREFLLQSGGWDSEIGGWDDWELGVRLLLNHPRIMINKEVRLNAVVQKNSITGLNFRHRMGDWEKTMDRVEESIRSHSDDPEYKLMLRLLAYRRVNLAAHYRKEGEAEAGRKLFREALRMPDLNFFHRMILHLAYRYTSAGLPFAGAIFPPLLRIN